MYRTRKVHSLTQIAFYPLLFPVNCYLLEEEDGLTLIDAALPNSTKGIIHTAASLGRPITRIVLTHAHFDHVGALDAVKQAFPNAVVHISARDAKLLGGDTSMEVGEPEQPIRGSVPRGIRTKPDVLLQDGDRVGSLIAVSTPGHTPGSMSFLDTRHGLLVAGDALQTRGKVAVAGILVPWFPFPALATWDASAALDSARRLEELKPALLAVGHGRMLEEPSAAIQEAIQFAQSSMSRKRLRTNRR
ncbi:MBL fold metallo-hydrolase [Paenibacillus sp. YYML68]|uniref:MBL fold metallo-hydrolase n=1 Tax=Paenibacillus sp. YYML68 TaxID=2909250 RepID=UPI002492E945|nr:MBL fold metallo-hydrolase [Paenibacillus sp. YYML68]